MPTTLQQPYSGPAFIATDSQADPNAPQFSVQADAVVTEQHKIEVEVTSHPVEQGAPISDHSRQKPDSLNVEMIVSNWPASAAQASRANGDPSDLSSAPGYAEQVYAQFYNLAGSPVLLTIATTVRVYTSMLLTGCSAPRSAKEAGALRFSLTFQRVRLVQNKLTRTTQSKSGGKKKSTGAQTTKATPPAEDVAPLVKAAKGFGIDVPDADPSTLMSGG